MSVQEILTMTPTLAVMALVAFYREEVFCLWGCNPQIQAFNQSIRSTYTLASAAAEQQTRVAVDLLRTWFASLPEINREVIFRWIQSNIQTIPQIDTTTLSMYLYLIYTFAFAMILYAGLMAESRREEENVKKRVRVQTPSRRPITRSMTRDRLTASV